MVHNGIEYGVMAAYAEGLNILANADAGLRERDQDAETAPLENPEWYRYEIDTTEVAEVWRRGSVISSWLLDLAAEALHASPRLEEFAGRVSDSGEGRWTTLAAIDEGVPAGPDRCPLLPLQLPRPRRLRRQAPLGDAQAVRRPRGEGVLNRRDTRKGSPELRPSRYSDPWPAVCPSTTVLSTGVKPSAFSGAPGSGRSPVEAAAVAKKGLKKAVDDLLDPPKAQLIGPAPTEDGGAPLAPRDAWGHDYLW